MHTILLKRVKFSNILSYGNALHEVIFDEDGGLIWVRGSNGAGKSTIIEALTFAFFGKPYRNINIVHLKNTANPNVKMFVEVEFVRIDSKTTDTYVIERTMNSGGNTSFKITINNVTEPKGAGTTQKKIEEEYLGFNKHIFENIISLNTINTKPIIDMEPKEKRKLIEAILTLQIDKLKDINSKELSKALTKFESATSDVVKYTRDVRELEAIIEKMKQERENDLTELRKELKELNVELVDAESILRESTDIVADIVKRGKDTKQASDALGDIDQEIAKLESVKVLIPQYQKDKESLAEAVTAHAKCEDELRKLEANCEGHDPLTINAEIKKHQDTLKQTETKINKIEFEQTSQFKKMEDIKKHVADLKAGVPCNTCGKPSTEADVEKIKATYRVEYKAIQTSHTELGGVLTHLKKTVDEIRTTISEYEAKLAQANALAQVVTDYRWGEHQRSGFTVSSWKKTVTEKERQINEIGYSDIASIEARIETLSQKKVEKDALTKKLNDLRIELSAAKEHETADSNIVKGLKTRVDALSKKIAEKSQLSDSDSLSSTIQKLENASKDLITARERVDKYSDRIAIKEFLKGMYGDNGIKKLVLGIFIPNLNNAIAHNLRLFNLPYTIAFDDAMEIKFSSRYGMAEVFDGLSEGQKRKINFAIAISFRDFVTKIADFKINLLFLDEVLDISTDMEALQDMIRLVKSKVSEIGNIYLITHRGDAFEEYFDGCVEATNDGRYSTIRQFKMTSTATNY